jgi:hypothetical protein
VPVKLKFLGEKFYLVVSPIHPPLGGIKVLSGVHTDTLACATLRPASRAAVVTAVRRALGGGVARAPIEGAEQAPGGGTARAPGGGETRDPEGEQEHLR